MAGRSDTSSAGWTGRRKHLCVVVGRCDCKPPGNERQYLMIPHHYTGRFMLILICVVIPFRQDVRLRRVQASGKSNHPANKLMFTSITGPITNPTPKVVSQAQCFSRGSNHKNGSVDIPSSSRPTRPLSTAEELISSAVSGSTLARALMSNSFILPSDSRASRFLRGAGGLTRSDSTTLPRPEHSYGAYSEDVFSISPDAPPIPSNAEALYRPPKKLREVMERGSKSAEALTRQGSGSSVKALPKPPSTASARSSPLLSPGKEFDMADIIHSSTADTRRTPPVPRSPLPLPANAQNFHI